MTEFLPQGGDLNARRARARTELPGKAEAWLLKHPAADQRPAAQPAVALTLPRHTAVA